MKIKQMIVDADICLKLGNSEKFLFLEVILPKIAEKVYIQGCENTLGYFRKEQGVV